MLRERNIRGRNYIKKAFGNIVNFKRKKKNARMGDLKFGVVVALKNIKGENRIEEFKHSCLLRGYILNEINIKK